MKEQIMQVLIDTTVKMFGVDADTLGPNTNFKEDLACKSANMVQFLAALEDEFDIEVPYMEFNRKATFDEAADYVLELCEE